MSRKIGIYGSGFISGAMQSITGNESTVNLKTLDAVNDDYISVLIVGKVVGEDIEKLTKIRNENLETGIIFLTEEPLEEYHVKEDAKDGLFDLVVIHDDAFARTEPEVVHSLCNHYVRFTDRGALVIEENVFSDLYTSEEVSAPDTGTAPTDTAGTGVNLCIGIMAGLCGMLTLSDALRLGHFLVGQNLLTVGVQSPTVIQINYFLQTYQPQIDERYIVELGGDECTL